MLTVQKVEGFPPHFIITDVLKWKVLLQVPEEHTLSLMADENMWTYTVSKSFQAASNWNDTTMNESSASPPTRLHQEGTT